MKVFISGGITNVPNYKIQFDIRSKRLREAGYEPVNPVFYGERLKNKLKREPTHEEYMAETIRVLSECEGISMLGNWRYSKGAIEEYEYAVAHNKVFVDVKILGGKW